MVMNEKVMLVMEPNVRIVLGCFFFFFLLSTASKGLSIYGLKSGIVYKSSS